MLKIVPTPEFVKQVKKLAKSYKKIASDLESLKKELLQNPKTEKQNISDQELSEVLKNNNL